MAPKAKIAMKKPLTKGKCPKEKDASAKGQDLKPNGKHWNKLRLTYGKKPERAYVTAQDAPGAKFKLLVEVSKKRTIHYQNVIESIYKEVEAKGLTKAQCLELRQKLCCGD